MTALLYKISDLLHPKRFLRNGAVLGIAGSVLVCICPWQRARAHVYVVVYCVVFIIPASISPKLKFCIALSIDHEATAARSSVSCVKYDYRYSD